MATMRTRCRSLLLSGLLAFLLPGPAAAQAPVTPRPDRAPEIRMGGDTVVLPLVIVRNYPFVQGSIAGVPGKLMLDTGADQALAVNDHRVSLKDGVVSGTGHFSSGQSFQTRMNAVVPDIAFGPFHSPQATQVASQDATQLEHITPDFLGWIGYYFWQGYAMKLDYVRSEATFYRGSSEQYLSGETVVGTIPFQTRKLPNHPLVHARLGDVDAIAAFDTGQYGTLFTDEPTKARLLHQGVLRDTGHGSFDLKGWSLDGKSATDIPNIDVQTGTFPAADPIGIPERTVLAVGYGFLSQYKTVWDYRSHRISLLAR